MKQVLISGSCPQAPPSRREVVRSSLALALTPPFCCSTPIIPPESVSRRGGLLIVDLKGAPGLREVGAAGAVVDAKVNLIVAHVEKARYIAVDRSCTHGGAQVAYNHKRKTVRCTSLNHAEFDLHGVLLHGRTHGNLRAYETRVDGNRLEIVLEA
jgi:nitrite reductase/ring-hydroxylating ferredoxin subunit